MSKPPDAILELSETLTLCEHQDPKNGAFGFWLYDSTRGMNLAMRAKSSTEAFVEAIEYYQRRLTEVEQGYHELRTKVDAFLEQFADDED